MTGSASMRRVTFSGVFPILRAAPFLQSGVQQAHFSLRRSVHDRRASEESVPHSGFWKIGCVRFGSSFGSASVKKPRCVDDR